MEKDFLTIDGKEYRVEINWNTIVAFLATEGKDNWDGLTSFAKVAPSEVAPLIAAAVNEGERLEGRECNFSGKDIGAICGFDVVGKFLTIYQKQALPKSTPAEDDKKKD